jgi:hypothetical protein
MSVSHCVVTQGMNRFLSRNAIRAPSALPPHAACDAARLGHNGGPPFDLSWNAWAWRRAHAKAWQSPGRDIAGLRLRRAERLGLSYRAYTSVLMDRGVHLAGLVLLWDEHTQNYRKAIAAKLATLKDCRIILCSESGVELNELAQPAQDVAYSSAVYANLDDAIRKSAASVGTSTSAFFAVGWTPAHRALAGSLKLGLFVSALEYFGLAFANA